MSRHSVGRPNMTADIVPVLLLPLGWVVILAWIWAGTGGSEAITYIAGSGIAACWMLGREDLR